MFIRDIDNFYNNCSCESISACDCKDNARNEFAERVDILTIFKNEHLDYLDAVIPIEIFRLLDEGWDIEQLSDRCNGTAIMLSDDRKP
jgi:hypothetical protein